MAKVNHNHHQQHHEQQYKQSQESLQQSIDIDELAREKVQEVEILLDSTDSLNPELVNSWLSVLKQIITAADLHRTNDKNDCNDNTKTRTEDESIYADYADDNEQFNAIDLTEQFATNSVKWTIRVRAFKVFHRLVKTLCNINHRKSYILKHLPDLVRLSFIAATSPYDDLKIQGFEMFKFVIIKFASVEEREFPGHSILDQYRTQVLSALKPAFNLDAPPYITAIASQVSSLWICKGLEGDPSSLKRFYQLMMATIDKLENQSVNQNSKLYTESELEQERLNILGSWAQLYIKSREHEVNIKFNDSDQPSSPVITKLDTKLLHELIQPQISSLIDKWWEALKDYALLIMPARRMPGISHDSEHVYTREVALGLFASVWPSLVLASTIWLCHDEIAKSESRLNLHGGKSINNTSNKCDNESDQAYEKYLKFICGILIKELIICLSENEIPKETLPESTIFVIRSLFILVNNNEMKSAFVKDLTIAQEFYTAIYKILIKCTRNRSYHSTALKNLLELIFNLVLGEVQSKPGIKKQTADFLFSSVHKNLTMVSKAVEDGDMRSIDILKLNLEVRLANLKAIYKLERTERTPDEIAIDDAMINSFKSMICFEGEPSINLICLDHLREVLATVSKDLISNIVISTYKPKLDHVKKLFSKVLDEKVGTNNKTNTPTILLEAYLKSARYFICQTGKEDRGRYLEDLLETLLHEVLDLQRERDSPNKVIVAKRKELYDLCDRHLRDLNSVYEFEIVHSLKYNPGLKKTYDKVMTLKDDLRVGDSAKRSTQHQKTKISSAGNQIRQPAKIVLKADFSNFYAKKP